MKYNIIFLLILFISCEETRSQQKRELLGTCEGCEAVFEYGNRTLKSIDTLPDFNDPGSRIRISGTIYKADGRTPAKDVILYVYHTDQQGVYPTKGNEKNWSRRHGYIRTWLKTDAQGRYTFFTLRPGIYPDRNAPAHIHATILEPDGKYYWIADYYFSDDSLLPERDRNDPSPRGGNGVLTLKQANGILTATRDIVLRKNVY